MPEFSNHGGKRAVLQVDSQPDCYIEEMVTLAENEQDRCVTPNEVRNTSELIYVRLSFCRAAFSHHTI